MSFMSGAQELGLDIVKAGLTTIGSCAGGSLYSSVAEIVNKADACRDWMRQVRQIEAEEEAAKKAAKKKKKKRNKNDY